MLAITSVPLFQSHGFGAGRALLKKQVNRPRVGRMLKGTRTTNFDKIRVSPNRESSSIMRSWLLAWRGRANDQRSRPAGGYEGYFLDGRRVCIAWATDD